MKVSRGIIQDVLIKVDKFYFPVDFLVLDVESIPNSKKQIPVILSFPFLATANALLNCRTGVIDLLFGNINVRLNVFNASNQPSIDDECYIINFRDELDDDYAMLGGDNELISCEGGNDIFEVGKSIKELEELLNYPPSPGEVRFDEEFFITRGI